MSNIRPTDLQEFLGDLDAGIFANKIAHALSEAAAGVVANEKKKGQVTVTFTMEHIAGSSQVKIDHKLSYVVPHRTGKFGDESTTQTPMHVNDGGKLTLFQENQGQMFGKPAPAESQS